MDIERKTIFLVDDDITNLAVGKVALAERYNVFTFNSCSKFLKMLEKNIPDLILLDIEMPEMNGYDAIEIIKSRNETEHIPVIFLTARSDAEGELEGLSHGAVDYIIKPFSAPILIKRIDVHLLVEAQKKELVNFNNSLQEMVEQKTKSVMELQNAILNTMAELVECRDDITGGHIERTTSYLGVLLDALAILGLYEKEMASWDLKLLLQSAQLHDVGKIAVKDSILQKTDRLTIEEFEEIKKHTVFGKDVIEKIKRKTSEQAFLEHAGIFAESHHEKWDGSGYPYGLKGDEIPLQGRLMAIADVYDALVSDRPYKEALAHEEAVDIIMNGKGTHFDPVLVDIFIKVADEFSRIAEAFKKEKSP
jgi:putative two-component system response regulator